MTPFEALYGYIPPRILDYVPGVTKLGAVDSFLRTRHELLPLLKQNLTSAQARMKLLVDQHRSDKSFSVGDWVHIKLQPYRQFSLRVKGHTKISPRFFGPFQIVQCIGEVAYKVALPKDCPIQLVFHISCLRQKLGAQVIPLPSLPSMDSAGILQLEPVAILQQRSKQLRSRTITEVLVQWQGQSTKDATWESLYVLHNKFPHLVFKVL
ncbi:uncharacterized protein LOC112016101 [Quercus suber]|uniref:uncharacterized protein LOC112016101 n=1 Tax=Quercus suber TaxID=58331 RepID=UPI000CE263B2|nr:uncharacterized protein LOC112016101 [Quercus suber]